MPRPKAFDRDDALRRAIPVFWAKGYGATSTDDLVQAMGIGRQSLYDTFGDKHRLFLEALRVYNTESVGATLKKLRAGPSSLAAIEAVLVEMAEEREARRALGCLGVNSICELGKEDADVRALSATSGAFLESGLESAVEEGQARGEIKASLSPRAAARFLAATLSGMKVQAKAGASAEVLRDVASFAVASLRAG